MMLMMGVLAGAKHLSHLAILKADVAIRKLFGWKLFPDASTFGKLLNTDFHSPYNRHYNHNQGVQTILRGQLSSQGTRKG